jgi:hypothetical protein
LPRSVSSGFFWQYASSIGPTVNEPASSQRAEAFVELEAARAIHPCSPPSK